MILANKHTIYHKQIGHVSRPYGISKHRCWLHHRDLDQQCNRPKINDTTSQTMIHYVRLGVLHNRINILSWRQAFTWHQARLSQVWENVKLHVFIYTWSVLENVCVYNIILIRWLYTISFGHIIISWCYCHAEDVSPHFDGMLFSVADVNNHKGWCYLPVSYVGFWQMLLPSNCGRCYSHLYHWGWCDCLLCYFC